MRDHNSGGFRLLLLSLGVAMQSHHRLGDELRLGIANRALPRVCNLGLPIICFSSWVIKPVIINAINKKKLKFV